MDQTMNIITNVIVGSRLVFYNFNKRCLHGLADRQHNVAYFLLFINCIIKYLYWHQLFLVIMNYIFIYFYGINPFTIVIYIVAVL